MPGSWWELKQIRVCILVLPFRSYISAGQWIKRWKMRLVASLGPLGPVIHSVSLALLVASGCSPIPHSCLPLKGAACWKVPKRSGSQAEDSDNRWQWLSDGCCYYSVTKSDSLWPRGPQHARLCCSSLSPGVCSNSCPWSQWYYLTISSSAAPFSFCDW